MRHEAVRNHEDLRAGQPSADNEHPLADVEDSAGKSEDLAVTGSLLAQPGTFTFKHDYRWFRSELTDLPQMEILVWRSVSTQFLRALVHPQILGNTALQILYWLEERLPRFLGRHGQYPMIVFHKSLGGQGHGVE